MEVYFDWELDEKLQQPVNYWVYDDLRNFIKSRFSPLNEQIDNLTIPEKPAFAVFCWLESGDISCHFFNVTPELEEKLKISLTQADMDYIMETIGRKIDNEQKGQNP